MNQQTKLEASLKIHDYAKKILVALIPPLVIAGGALIGPLAAKYPMSD